MGLTDLVAEFIRQSLAEEQALILKRNELAERFGCAPSQINYVLATRFSPEQGYIVESRRGGGGYIRIIKKHLSKDEYLMHFIYAIGDKVSEGEARAYVRNLYENELISEREGKIMLASLNEKTLSSVPAAARPTVRADILKQILLNLL